MTGRHLTVVAALIASISVAISAQNAVDDLIAKNVAAKGGLEKLKSIQSMKQISTMTTQGVEATITVYSKRPNLQRQEVRIAGQTITNGFDGEVSWIINPLSGMTRPIVVTGPQADIIREQAAFDGPLVDYQARGSKVLLSGGVETIGDRKVQHLQVITRAQQTQHIYLDAETNLDIKIVSILDGRKFEQELSDYREVEGVKVPFKIKMLVEGVQQSQVNLQSVEFNVKIDDAMFKAVK
jgi:outer membrane lipoprotein-sorting protein